MKKRRIKFAVCFMTGIMVFCGFGIISMASSTKTSISDDLSQTDTLNTETDNEDNMAIAQISEDAYVYIREEANAKNGTILGKLYNNSVAAILGQEGDWYLINSGTITGYVKKTHFITGVQAKELIQKIGQQYAVVGSQTIMVRSDASNNANIICMVGDTARLPIEEDLGDWVKVTVDSDVVGYVPKDYVSCETEFAEAESMEEEELRLAEEESVYLAALEEARIADEAAQQAEGDAQETADLQNYEAAAQEDTLVQDERYLSAAAQEAADQAEADAQASADAQAAADAQYQAEADAQSAQERGYPLPEYGGNTSYNQGQQFGDVYGSNWMPTTSGIRQSVVSFALQFVGNPYVWGGTSLTNGADCSGFTQSVMANFGISIPRVAQDQAGSGREVALSNIQPGDLLFYNGDGEIGHVTMYIGNNQVVHASSSTTGIIVSDLSYRQACSARSYID